MKSILFDVDDTLYNQLVPFQKAFEKNFNFNDIPMEQLYKISRKLSDNVFELSESGQMDIQDMHIFRIKKAMEHFNKKITNQDAIAFQEDYSQFQSEIKLIPDVEASLKYLKEKGATLGIITNGPKEHQWNKIKKLEVEKWIPHENILISSEVGLSKPNSKIFLLASTRMQLNQTETYYIGDSFSNDIVGAKQVGWKAVWSNRRNHPEPKGNVKADHIINEECTLLQFVKEIVS